MVYQYDTHRHRQRSYQVVTTEEALMPEMELQHAIYAQAVMDLITGLCTNDQYVIRETESFLRSGSYELAPSLGEYLIERAHTEYQDALGVIRHFAGTNTRTMLVDPERHSVEVLKLLIRTQYRKKLSCQRRYQYQNGPYVLKYKRGVCSLGTQA